MADNYLEKKMEEYRSSTGSRVSMPSRPGLDTLLLRNRSCRGFVRDHIVKRLQLERMVEATTRVASARNQQVLRYRLVTSDDAQMCSVLQSAIHLGAGLADMHLPLEGTEPGAFIVVCSTVPEGRYVDIDLGIAAQTMLLKGVELGLNGIIVCAFDAEKLQKDMDLPYPPLCVIAVGRSAENYRLKKVHAGDSLAYYREDGVHVVPKLQLQDILL